MGISLPRQARSIETRGQYMPILLVATLSYQYCRIVSKFIGVQFYKRRSIKCLKDKMQQQMSSSMAEEKAGCRV